MKNSADVNRKFVAITIAWMTVVTTFLVRDIQAGISWNPTQFFSMVKNYTDFTYRFVNIQFMVADPSRPGYKIITFQKVVAIFPNDFHCMRLIHNIEIWMVLIMCLKSGPKLTNIIENFNSLGFIGSTRSYAGKK